jgi:hypothetical protein
MSRLFSAHLSLVNPLPCRGGADEGRAEERLIPGAWSARQERSPQSSYRRPLASGAFNGGPISGATPGLQIEASRVVDNGATISVAADGGSAGRGIGRGIYVTTSGVADADVLTATDDVFATLAQR